MVWLAGRAGGINLAPMFRRAFRFSATLLLALALSGCMLLSFGKNKRKAKKQEEAGPIRVGRVALVNSDERFVLIEAAMVQPPVAGTLLRAYHGSAVSAELKATGVRRRPFLVADLVSGNPSKDDVIMQPPTTEPEAPKAAAPGAPAATPAPATEEAAPPKPKTGWKRWLGFFGRH